MTNIIMIIIIIIIIIISIFKENNVFSMIASLPYGPPVNTDTDYYQTFFRILLFCECCIDEPRFHRGCPSHSI